MISRKHAIITAIICLISNQSEAMKRAGDLMLQQPSKRLKTDDFSMISLGVSQEEHSKFLDKQLSHSIKEKDLVAAKICAKRINEQGKNIATQGMLRVFLCYGLPDNDRVTLFKELHNADFTAVIPGEKTTLLHDAVKNNQISIVNYFLFEKKIDPNIKNLEGAVPLLYAPNEKIAYSLWKAGADINAKDTDGRGILHWSAGQYCHEEEVAKFALVRGAELSPDDYGEMPYDFFKREFRFPNPILKSEESANKAILIHVSEKLSKPVHQFVFDRAMGLDKRTPYQVL